ncbi:distal tail protein Dit [Gracilibacillus alcaliphilus]|uniref:distal tail protein Dit n=1 Tax=Gracilibacillus alcaliphilus TaxID=1401441 RepID=UPI00195D0ACF|nr:distal tail protein Dit [Gracilibacillus alcaliphilus]MBM7678374.1 putative phage tail component-like protein [Gracilibacillus alcaliphilus]
MILLDDKYRPSNFGLVLEEGHSHPTTGKIVNKTTSIPGMPGRWNFGSEIQEKPFNLPFGTQGRDRNKLQQQLNDFVSFLFNEHGRPRLFKLVYDYEPDKYYMVQVSDQFDPERVRPFARFNLPLVANDPHKYLIVDSDEITWGSTEVVFNSTSIPFGHLGIGIQQITQPQTITFQGLGLAVIPKITISGNARGLILRANDKSMSFPNFNNETWIIDGTDFTVKRNGVDVFLDNIDFLEFFKGENELQISGNNLNFSLSVKFKDKFN